MKFEIGSKVWWKKEPHMSGIINSACENGDTVLFCVNITFPLQKEIRVPAEELCIYEDYRNNHWTQHSLKSEPR